VELIDKVMVYDVSGKLIQEKKKVENTELILSGINAPEQVFIVKVFLINGTTKKSFLDTQKIFLKSHSLLRMGFFIIWFFINQYVWIFRW
jgi:hypothetical protein